MASDQINVLKRSWNSIEKALILNRGAVFADSRITDMMTAWFGFGDFVQALIGRAIAKEEPDAKPEMVPPSRSGASDGYYGFRIEGLHQDVHYDLECLRKYAERKREGEES